MIRGPQSVSRQEGTPLGKMRCLEKIILKNGLTVEVWDRSVSIASDTEKVELYFKVPIPLKPEDFSCPDDYRMVREVLGDEPCFESRMIRSFVSLGDADRIRAEFGEIFRKDLLPYLDRPHFRRAFALAKHREILKDPCRRKVDSKET